MEWPRNRPLPPRRFPHIAAARHVVDDGQRKNLHVMLRASGIPTGNQQRRLPGITSRNNRGSGRIPQFNLPQLLTQESSDLPSDCGNENINALHLSKQFGAAAFFAQARAETGLEDQQTGPQANFPQHVSCFNVRSCSESSSGP